MAGQKIISGTWNQHMLNGDFESAWQKSDENLARLGNESTWHLPRHQQTIWRGAPLHNKNVLVRCYHGLGDTIQFARFLPLLRQEVRSVTVWTQEALIPLLQTVSGIDVLLPLHDGTPDGEYDADIEIMELAYYFRATLATLPATIPYLYAPPLLLNSNSRPAVGLVWKPGDWDPRRVLPFPELLPLFDLNEVDVFILQANAAEAGWLPGYGIHPRQFSLPDYAGVLAGLDLLISADFMPVHLAGALGRPVYTLLHTESDWRWMHNRNDSPWYPTMRLFRQTTAGDWGTVVQQVITAIQKNCFRKTI